MQFFQDIQVHSSRGNFKRGMPYEKAALCRTAFPGRRGSYGDNPGGDYRLSCWFVSLYINRVCGLNGVRFLMSSVFTDCLVCKIFLCISTAFADFFLLRLRASAYHIASMMPKLPVLNNARFGAFFPSQNPKAYYFYTPLQICPVLFFIAVGQVDKK